MTRQVPHGVSLELHDDGSCEWWFGDAHALFSSRAGGVSRAPFDSLNLGLHVGDEPEAVLENRARVAHRAGLRPASVATVEQTHGSDVWTDLARDGHELPAEVRWDEGRAAIQADALVTTRRGVGLAVAVADCVPIAVACGEATAAIHAGWRGLAGGVVEAAAAVLLRVAGSAAAIAGASRAVIGPCIGPCCFEVGEDVATLFDPASVRRDRVRPRLDARTDAARRLERVGISVDVVDLCTCCDRRSFSHRRDGPRTGRQGLVVCRPLDRSAR